MINMNANCSSVGIIAKQVIEYIDIACLIIRVCIYQNKDKIYLTYVSFLQINIFRRGVS